MEIPIPTNLLGFATALSTSDGRQFKIRSGKGGTLVEIRYFGELMEGAGLIVGPNDGNYPPTPALVVAIAVDTGEEVILFDGARHGYDAMFVEEFDPEVISARAATSVLERSGRTEFEVEVAVFDGIDWDDEEDDFKGEDGAIRLITGEEITPEQLRADGFDAISVEVITPDGQRSEIVAEELA